MKYGDLKFCQIRADLCIEGYPERNTPTIIVYRDGDIKRQVVTLGQLNGPRTNIANLEQLLCEIGAIKENDMRLKERTDDDVGPSGANGNADDSDDDWD